MNHADRSDNKFTDIIYSTILKLVLATTTNSPIT